MNKCNLNICLIGGTHPRHLFYSNAINKEFGLVGAIIQGREDLMPETPHFSSKIDEKNYRRHFEDRRKAELKYFGKQDLPDCERLIVKKEELNSQLTVDFINKIKPDMVFVFGCGLIKEPLLDVMPAETINLHLGLSPRYRGAATLFWPFYFLEPNYAGSTFHYVIKEADAGIIIHHVVPELDKNDRIHDVACKTVIKSTREALKLIKLFQKQGFWKTREQKSSGKLFLSNDFRPEHLRVIYNAYNNNIVRLYLEKKIIPKEPNLFNQFKTN